MDFDFTAVVSTPRYSAHTNGGAHFIGARKTKAQAEAVVTALALDSLRRYGSGTVADIAGRLDCSPDVARRVLGRLVVHNAARRKETRDGSLYIAVREPVAAAPRVVKRVQPTNDGTVEPFILKPDETARGAIVRYFQERGGEASSKTLYLAFEGQRYWTRDSIASHARHLASRGILKRRHERQNTSGGRQPFALYSLGDVPTDAEETVEPFLMKAGESVYAAIIRFFQERGGEASASSLFSAFAGQRGLTRETVASFASALAYRGTLNKRQVCPGLGRPYVAYSLGDVPHTELIDASQLRARGAVASFDSKYEVLKTLNAVGGLVRTVALAERSRYSVKTCRLVCVLLAQEGKVRAYKTARARGDYLWEALASENEL